MGEEKLVEKVVDIHEVRRLKHLQQVKAWQNRNRELVRARNRDAGKRHRERKAELSQQVSALNAERASLEQQRDGLLIEQFVTLGLRLLASKR